MPKERFHLLLAEHVLPILAALFPVRKTERLAYFLGAIAPDTLFYDLPFFRSSPIAGTLHRHEGLPGLEFLASIMAATRPALTPETGMWLLGVGVHLLTDGFWHPRIEKITALEYRHAPQASFVLTKRESHHWLESALEGFWLARAGPAGGYRHWLKDFATPGETREACIGCFRTLLRRLGPGELPDARRIARCFSWQALCLDQFSLPGWARCQNLLLRFRSTRFWGTLIVPPRADQTTLSGLKAQAGSHYSDALDELFSEQLMARSLNFLAVSLPSLAARL